MNRHILAVLIGITITVHYSSNTPALDKSLQFSGDDQATVFCTAKEFAEKKHGKIELPAGTYDLNCDGSVTNGTITLGPNGWSPPVTLTPGTLLNPCPTCVGSPTTITQSPATVGAIDN